MPVCRSNEKTVSIRIRIPVTEENIIIKKPQVSYQFAHLIILHRFVDLDIGFVLFHNLLVLLHF